MAGGDGFADALATAFARTEQEKRWCMNVDPWPAPGDPLWKESRELLHSVHEGASFCSWDAHLVRDAQGARRLLLFRTFCREIARPIGGPSMHAAPGLYERACREDIEDRLEAAGLRSEQSVVRWLLGFDDRLPDGRGWMPDPLRDFPRRLSDALAGTFAAFGVFGAASEDTVRLLLPAMAPAAVDCALDAVRGVPLARALLPRALDRVAAASGRPELRDEATLIHLELMGL